MHRPDAEGYPGNPVAIMSENGRSTVNGMAGIGALFSAIPQMTGSFHGKS